MIREKQLLNKILSAKIDNSRYSSQEHSPQQDYDSRDITSNHDDPQIDSIIKSKVRAFSKWQLRKSLPISPRRRRITGRDKSTQELSSLQNNSSFKINMSLLMNKSRGENSNKKLLKQRSHINQRQQKGKIKLEKINKNLLSKKGQTSRNVSPLPQKQYDNRQVRHLSAEQQAVHSDRRQRFKKLQNPMVFIKHYIQNQNYQPTPQQKQLIQKLIGIRNLLDEQPPKLDLILTKIYKFMNLIVDYNQLLLLSLVVLLAADVCLYMKDLSKAFYFYNQARIAGSYAHLDKLKISALIGIGKIAVELQNYQDSSKVFKKALQYAWRAKDQDTELEIYDWLGMTLYNEGKVSESQYYHLRYSHSEVEKENSALKKISLDILKEYDRHIFSLEDSNLDTLFIEYLNLPISKDAVQKTSINKQFKNYSNGQSPRMKKHKQQFNPKFFVDAKIQLEQLIKEDYQFISQIENPDSHEMFVQTKKFGKNKHELDFEHSFEFHRIVGLKKEKTPMDKQLKLPLDIQVQKMMKDKMENNWWEKMVAEARKKRIQKVGALRERVRNSSYLKYPSQRKKKQIWSVDQIRQSVNRTLLDWIDPKQSHKN